MFSSYFKTASRTLLRNRNYTIINIAGLAVGIAVCLMIFIIIQFQTSFDNFHPKKARIYRVLTEYHHADAANIVYGKDVPFPMPIGLKAAFPQVEQVAPVWESQNDQLRIPTSFILCTAMNEAKPYNPRQLRNIAMAAKILYSCAN